MFTTSPQKRRSRPARALLPVKIIGDRQPIHRGREIDASATV